MKIKIDTQISNNYADDEIEIIIKASKLSKKIENIIGRIQDANDNNLKTIVGRKDNVVTLIDTSDITKFYSRDQNNYCDTLEDTYKIRKKLYELENELDKNDFIRISNSCIANVKHIQYFDLSIIGNVTVIFKNGTKEDVSKRRISQILKFLKEKEG